MQFSPNIISGNEEQQRTSIFNMSLPQPTSFQGSFPGLGGNPPQIPVFNVPFPQFTQGVVNNCAAQNWIHVPPTHMPWGIPAADQPSIIRFTAEQIRSTSVPQFPESQPAFVSKASISPLKRRLFQDYEERSSKQLITEEKMTASLRQLCISNDSVHDDNASTEIAGSDYTFGCRVNNVREPAARLVMCDELRNFKTDPVLPLSLTSPLDKRSMALVLWKPPAGELGEQLESIRQASQTNEDQREEHNYHMPMGMQDNNNTSFVNLNSAFAPIRNSEQNDDAMDL